MCEPQKPRPALLNSSELNAKPVLPDTRKKGPSLYRTGVLVEDFARMTMIVYVAFFSLVFALRGHLKEEEIARITSRMR